MEPTALPDVMTDVLVVGSGASGLTAALTAADQGVKVLIIERGHLFGGTSATSGGTIWIPNNHLIGPAGGRDTPSEAEEYIRSLAGEFSSIERIKAFVEHAPRMTSSSRASKSTATIIQSCRAANRGFAAVRRCPSSATF